MECTRKELENKTCEIHVGFTGTEIITTYTRLRFALHASSWFPRPLGIVLWSVLHVLLLVTLPPFLVLLMLAMLVLSVLGDTLFLVGCWLPAVVAFVFLIYLFKLVGLLIVFSLLLITEGERLNRIRGVIRSFVEWWTHASWHSFVPGDFWDFVEMLEYPPPVMSPRCVVYLVRVGLPWYRRALRWCEEVVHMHDAVVI